MLPPSLPMVLDSTVETADVRCLVAVAAVVVIANDVRGSKCLEVSLSDGRY
jgi:hypothetical protein